ncbi:hypothetical protein H8L32_22890 [Undibacterium sp. CY18W]|uniref:Uncharacterized protein n=1 Tax=Undibacterium hunanense TaxID=2762292 RepID=A0ABR6ZWS4_9BURK|nr:hypothetical protein [Undibacterium hunanense]MBC3920329.1 hypothetical protein [Undibacterium hunanense]
MRQGNFLFGASALALVAALVYFLFHTDSDNYSPIIDNQKLKEQVSGQADLEKKKLLKSNHQNCIPNRSVSLYAQKAVAPISNSNREIGKAATAARKNPTEILTQIQNSRDIDEIGIYSVAIFDIAKICLQSQWKNTGVTYNLDATNFGSDTSFCQNLPQDVVANPLKILDDASQKGSSLAKTHYLMNAFVFAPIYKSIGTPEHIAFSNFIIERAKNYGEEAVKSGAQEANFLMSRAYTSGLFGKKDLTRALAYLLPLEQNLKSQGIGDSISEINSKLDESSKVQARNISVGCTGFDSSILMSPF